MNKKFLGRSIRLGFLCITLVGLAAGCKTYYGYVERQEPYHFQPMTMALVDYLGRDSVRDFQYYLSSHIILSKEDFTKRYKKVGGALNIDHTYSRETVEIDAYTRGVVVGTDTDKDGKMILVVCFSQNPGLTLRFIQSGDGDRFDLETQDGTVLYGSSRYQVLFDEKFTRLLIDVSSEGRIITQPRREPGRSLEGEPSGGTSAPTTPVVPPLSSGPDESSVPRSLRKEIEKQTAPISVTGELAAAYPPIVSPEEPAAPLVPPARYLPETAFSIPTPRVFGARLSANSAGSEIEAVTAQTPPDFLQALPQRVEDDLPLPGRYRVQVGAFLNADNARRTVERLRTAGLNPACIRQDEYYRVIIATAAEEDMPDIVRRLSLAGFSRSWVWENEEKK
jgi:hypothetical protein